MGKYKADKNELRKHADALCEELRRTRIDDFHSWVEQVILQPALEAAERRVYEQGRRSTV